jgi:hypothetical protein
MRPFTVVAVRHGLSRRCFTRDTAIRYLAFFMVTKTFQRSGFPNVTRGCVLIAMTGRYGETGNKGEYLAAHQRCVRRCVASGRKREMEKWLEMGRDA